MVLADVQASRALIDAMSFEVPKEDGTTETVQTPIMIYGSNNFNIITDYRDGSCIWDDDNQRLYYFNFNMAQDGSPYGSLSVGNVPKAPGYISIMPYNEIITIRAEFTKTTFEKLCTALGSIMDSETKEKLYHKFFVETDQEYIIKKSKEISYSTQSSKEYQKHLLLKENAEYRKTVHPVALY